MRFTTNQLTGLIDVIAGRYGLRATMWRVLARRHNTTLRLDASPIRTTGRSSAQATERFVAAVTSVGFLVQQRRDDLPQLASYFVEHLRKPAG